MLIRKPTIIFVILSLLVMTSCSLPVENTSTEPVIPENTILKPEFELSDTAFEAGTAFAIELEDENESLVLTAYHLFGEDGGLQEKIPADNLPSVFRKATFKDAYSDELCGDCEKVLKIKDADSGESVNKDIVAIYYGDKLNANRLKLSSKLPRKGEVVWLASPTMTSLEPKLHKATVRSASDKMLYFEYEEKDIVLQATSGAPIINSSGKVVGLNIGGGEQYGSMFGIANPCTSMLKMIKAALSEKDF